MATAGSANEVRQVMAMECAKWQWLATAMQCVEWQLRMVTAMECVEWRRLAAAMKCVEWRQWSAPSGNGWQRQCSALNGYRREVCQVITAGNGNEVCQMVTAMDALNGNSWQRQ